MFHHRRSDGSRFFLWLSAFLTLGVAAPVRAATMVVASYGVDSASCGSAMDPCRSITQAITNAAPGASITVGPGLYGDLNHNGTFGETGEEPAQIGTGCGCMVDVNKQLTIVSRDGAAATVIDAAGAAVTAVLIDGAAASDSVFGQNNKGFTLAGGSGVVGLTINNGATGVTVGGNISSHNDFGFRADASDSTFVNNRAEGNFFQGIFVTATSTLTANVATENVQNGIWLLGGGPHLLKGNISNANGGDGFIVDAVSGPGTVLQQNAAIGNTGSGVHITSTGSATVTKGSMFANASNCGLTDDSPSASTDAIKNFWGAATGPGSDPADAVCGTNAANVSVTPVLSKEAKVSVKSLK